MKETRDERTAAAALEETFSRAREMEPDWLDLSPRLGVPEGPGWVSPGELATDEALLEDLLGRVGKEADTDDRLVMGSFFLGDYLWKTLAPAVAAFLTDRRVPDLYASNLALRFDEKGEATGLALVEPRFAALSEDEDAGLASATFDSEEALLAHLRSTLEEDLPSIFGALRRRRPRRGMRVMWGAVVDAVVGSFSYLGEELGCEDEALSYAQTMLAGSSPISGTVGYYTLEYEGGSELVRINAACCLNYKVMGRACFSCPRTTDEERIERLRAH
jgi:hypothetical protein